MTPELAESFDGISAKGILVAQVAENSPAERAGLKQGDVITEYEGQAVSDTGSFRNRVSLTAPGTDTRIKVLRDGKAKTLSVTIGALPDETRVAAADRSEVNQLGFQVESITPALARQYKLDGMEGVVVTAVENNSLAARVGIRPGTLIHEVNRHVVRNAKEFDKRITESERAKKVLLLISNNERSQFVVLKW